MQAWHGAKRLALFSAEAVEPGGEHFLHVFAEDVGFDVHRIAGAADGERRLFERVRNEGDAEEGVADIDQREADAVDGDGAFGDHQLGEFGGHVEPHFHPLPFRLDARDGSEAVDVALHEVAAESGLRGEGAFQIDRIARLQTAQVGAGKRFAAGLEIPAIVGEFDHGETTAVDGDAVSQFDGRVAVIGRAHRFRWSDFQADASLFLQQFGNLALPFNQPCKHND